MSYESTDDEIRQRMHNLSIDVEYCSDRLNFKRMLRIRKELCKIDELYQRDRDADGYQEVAE